MSKKKYIWNFVSSSILLVLTLIWLSFGCTKNKEMQLEIYYYEDEINTPERVSCDEIFGYHGLKRLVLNNKKYNDSINYLLGNFKERDLNNIDVRYKLILSNDTICMDYFGNIIYKGIVKTDNDKKFYHYINLIISKHKKDAQRRKGDELPKLLRDKTDTIH